MNCQLTLRYSTLSNIADFVVSLSRRAQSRVFSSSPRFCCPFARRRRISWKENKVSDYTAGHGFSCSLCPQMGFMSRFSSRCLRHRGNVKFKTVVELFGECRGRSRFSWSHMFDAVAFGFFMAFRSIWLQSILRIVISETTLENLKPRSGCVKLRRNSATAKVGTT